MRFVVRRPSSGSAYAERWEAEIRARLLHTQEGNMPISRDFGLVQEVRRYKKGKFI